MTYAFRPRSHKPLGFIGFFLVFCAVSFPDYAWAYLDPATLTMIGQVIVAAIATVFVFLKLGWHRVKRFFAKLFGKEKSTAPNGTLPDASDKETPKSD